MRRHPTIVPAILQLAVAIAGCDSSGSANPPDPADSGGLKVGVSTAGTPVNGTGYYLTIGDKPGGVIAHNDSITREGLSPGSYQILLSSLPLNCTVSGENPMTVDVRPGTVATASFAVSCRPAAIVRVTTVTTGAELDRDGYTIKFGNNSSWLIPVAGISVLKVYAAGQTTLGLSGLAANCTADPGNPTAVTLVPDSTVPLAFRVDCGPTKGTVKVSVSIGGVDRQSLQGLSAGLDNSREAAFDNSGSATFTDVPVGAHTAALRGIQSNCGTTGSSTQAAQVTGRDTTMVHFEVNCRALPNVGASVSTTGVELDTDGYTVRLGFDFLGGGSVRVYPFAVPTNGRAVGVHVIPRSYLLRLDGVAKNCRATGVPQSFAVGQADTTIAIAVTCGPSS